ncbi:MAG TPA: NAD(P)H-dependent oxidoreductase [Beijerinckiaceae bacterium]|jgi:multimeric flavodoxin WrbA
MALKIFALNCSLKGGDEPSSTDRLLGELIAELGKHGATGEIVRAADHDIKPGVKSDMGPGDAWPGLRARIMACDIFILGTPIWLGQPSSVAKRVCERMDAFISETDDRNRMPSYGKVALVAVVGNEDGAHHVSAEMFQALNDVGFTIPANGMTYWVGEAMGSKDYKELGATPKTVARANQMAAASAAHLANLLKAQEYPGFA